MCTSDRGEFTGIRATRTRGCRRSRPPRFDTPVDPAESTVRASGGRFMPVSFACPIRGWIPALAILVLVAATNLCPGRVAPRRHGGLLHAGLRGSRVRPRRLRRRLRDLPRRPDLAHPLRPVRGRERTVVTGPRPARGPKLLGRSRAVSPSTPPTTYDAWNMNVRWPATMARSGPMPTRRRTDLRDPPLPEAVDSDRS